MKGQLCWLPRLGDDTKVLHLRKSTEEPWQVYTSSSFAVPDYRVPGGSKGWATYQKLKELGWELISTQKAETEEDSIPQEAKTQ